VTNSGNRRSLVEEREQADDTGDVEERYRAWVQDMHRRYEVERRDLTNSNFADSDTLGYVTTDVSRPPHYQRVFSVVVPPSLAPPRPATVTIQSTKRFQLPTYPALSTLSCLQGLKQSISSLLTTSGTKGGQVTYLRSSMRSQAASNTRQKMPRYTAIFLRTKPLLSTPKATGTQEGVNYMCRSFALLFAVNPSPPRILPIRPSAITKQTRKISQNSVFQFLCILVVYIFWK
jgi:hypothetical protein